MRVKNNDAFTLLEILIVIGMIVVLAVLAILLFNPKKQIEKAWDAKRKQDLIEIRTAFENYYNDKMSYPSSNDVCYGEILNIDDNCYCRICSPKKVNDKILGTNLCDPQSSNKDYLYQFDCNQSQPQWFRVCAILSNTYDIDASESAGTNYNYGISSNNIPPENCDSIDFGPTGVLATLTPTGIVTNTPTPMLTATPTLIPMPSPTSKQTLTPMPSPTPKQTLTPMPSPTPTTAPSCKDIGAKYCISGGYCNYCGPFADCVKYCTQKYPLYNDYHCVDPCEY